MRWHCIRRENNVLYDTIVQNSKALKSQMRSITCIVYMYTQGDWESLQAFFVFLKVDVHVLILLVACFISVEVNIQPFYRTFHIIAII